MNDKTIRAFFRATKVDSAKPPYDTLHLKVFYPAQMLGGERERNLGIVPADIESAPFPVVIFFSGFNCGAEVYQWLAVKLAQRGLVVVTFNWVAENLPGFVSLTPGVDFAKGTPDLYGTGATASALPAILAELQHLQTEGILAGMLDLQKVILGGHSAGGRVAIENANPQFFPQLAAAFAYGSHTAGAMALGYQPNTILPLPSSLPLLLMGGTCDGVIANSSDRYGVSSGNSTNLVIRTFSEAIAEGGGDSYLVLLEGANHFCIADPFDFTTGRAFLDFPATVPADKSRSLVAETISLFIDAHVRRQSTALQALKQLLNPDNNPLVQYFDCK